MFKILGLIFLAVITLGATAVVGGGVYIVSGGIAVCEVDTPEISLTVPVPMRLADIGLAIAMHAMPRHELEQLREEVDRFVPLIEAALEGVADVPDGTVLVRVKTAEEDVYIARERGKLVIDVDSPDATVHIKVPTRSIRSLSRSLGEFLSAR